MLVIGGVNPLLELPERVKCFLPNPLISKNIYRTFYIVKRPSVKDKKRNKKTDYWYTDKIN